MPKSTKAQDDDLEWIVVEDFTPGLVTNSQFSFTSPVPGNKLGQAQSAQGCIALPNGGLGPLPGLATETPWGATAPLAPHHSLATGVGAQNLICGLFLNGPLFYYGGSSPYPQSEGDELIIGQSQIQSGGNAELWIDSLQTNNTNQTSAYNNIITAGPSVHRLGLCTMTGGTTRAASDPADLGNSCWALAFWIASGTPATPAVGEWEVILYPDPTSPASFTPYGLITSTGNPGEVLCHQNRVVYLQWSPTIWSSDSTFMGGNEQFVYTDPPNGVDLIAGAEVFVQEDPSGYGTWGSQSASELFLVKNRIGGVVIQGDLNSPTVTVLPGVQPTYGLMSRGASTGVGFVYPSKDRGMWSWNGSNTSQKISEQLEDNFFANATIDALGIERGPTVDVQRWGDWIVTSNDYLFDTNTGGWWTLPEGSLGHVKHLWYQPSSDGDWLYAAFAAPTATVSIDCYSRLSPTTIFNWESYPIRPPSVDKNRNIDIREVVVRAQGDGTVTVNLTGLQGTTGGVQSPSATLTFETYPDQYQPSMQRVTGGLNAQDVQLEIQSSALSDGPAPIVYSVAIGYVEAPAKVSSG